MFSSACYNWLVVWRCPQDLGPEFFQRSGNVRRFFYDFANWFDLVLVLVGATRLRFDGLLDGRSGGTVGDVKKREPR